MQSPHCIPEVPASATEAESREPPRRSGQDQIRDRNKKIASSLDACIAFLCPGTLRTQLAAPGHDRHGTGKLCLQGKQCMQHLLFRRSICLTAHLLCTLRRGKCRDPDCLVIKNLQPDGLLQREPLPAIRSTCGIPGGQAQFFPYCGHALHERNKPLRLAIARNPIRNTQGLYLYFYLITFENPPVCSYHTDIFRSVSADCPKTQYSRRNCGFMCVICERGYICDCGMRDVLSDRTEKSEGT